MAKISATKIYNKADIGQPCRIPRNMLQFLDIQPLFLSRKTGFV